MEAEDPGAATIAGLLADPVRREVLSAIVLGASTREQVTERLDPLGRSAADVTKAMERLVSAGLVERNGGGLRLVAEVFGRAARADATARPGPGPVVDDLPAEQAKVVRAFVRDGRLVSIPAAAGKRRVILELVVQDFEPGRRYSEAMVNLICGRWYADTAALRRYLVDDDLLDRADGEYWRSGGRVIP